LSQAAEAGPAATARDLVRLVARGLVGPDPHCDGAAAVLAGIALLVAYVLLHDLFVSQTAHLLALFGVFLDVGVKLGVPVAPFAFLLLFATNFFSANTPQGSTANLLFAGSGYLSQGELYRLGALTTAFNLAIYLLVGTPWLVLVTR
jgi:divalent anion:Na+ symporter, DASS family